ncbi:MAG: YcjX family protein [Alteromonadaceae bacterium]|nr:YcjX family protein [Alteromonadaceae bacterium]
MAIINKEKLKKLKHKANDLFNRTLDQHVTLAVTGLSRSGKTAFITSFVNQLINEGNGSSLNFFNPIHQGRFIAAKRVPQKHFHIGRFDYDRSIGSFCNEPPTWPEPTHGISELRLAIRYQPKASLLKYATDTATLYLDISDYPGEWLLDLPMLNQTFEEWSEQTIQSLSQAPRYEFAQKFIEKINAIDPFQPACEDLLAQLSKEYTELLYHFRYELGLSVIQPGRFILPAELADAPILQFIPYSGFNNIDANAYKNASDDTFIGMLRARFIEYKERVVRKFYKEHFINFDRQIVLADCLTPLNNGPDSFADLQQAIAMILESFSYGKSSIFSRLFSPKIDKLLFAATKADHVTPEQHENLVSLLNQLVYQTKHQLNYDSIEMKTLAVASVKATNTGKSKHKGVSVPVIQGRSLESGKTMTVFPGSVPDKLPNDDFWQECGFNFIAFSPQESISEHECLPHLRMDQAMQFLLGDKMK